MRLKYIKNFTAIAVCAAMLCGCSGSGDGTDKTTSATEASSSASASKPESGSAAAIASEDDPVTEKEVKPLTVAINDVHNDYTPFGTADDTKELIDSLTGVKLLGLTRSGATVLKGKSGQSERFNGTNYEYSGIADADISCDEETDTSVYSFTLRSDVKFSDGEQLTADDVIFTLYALLDPSRGDSPLFDADIVGADNYRFDSAIAETLTADEIANALASEDMIPVLKEQIIVPVLEKQYANVCSMYDGSSDSMGTGTYDVYIQMYPDPDSLFIFLYSLNGDYTAPEGADSSTIISDVADMYKGNYKLLASMTEGSNSAYDLLARRAAVRYITESRLKDGETAEHITYISGISRTGTYSLSITVRGKGAGLEKALSSTVIAPLHYYGDKNSYSYADNRFGFEKGKAGSVYEAHKDAPLGAGAYKVKEYKDGEILLSANEYYYPGAPLIPDIRIMRASQGDAASLIADGVADITFADGSAGLYETVDAANLKLERIFPAISDDHGYGYIGINARTVNINGQPLSDESSALRKALQTAISCFGKDSVAEYYGSHGTVTEYPFIGNISIDTSSGEVSVPYSLNKDGEPIYSGEMTASQRSEAAKTACLGYFESAGYKLSEDGKKVAEAPEGGKLTFTALVTGGGSGSHPAFYALTKASDLLSEIGITLTVTDVTDPAVLWDTIMSGTQEIWAGAWNNSLREIYIDGYYGIKTDDLEKLVTDAENASAEDKNAAYLACYDLVINKFAVELPLYRKTSCILFSTQRIDVSTVPADLTGTCDWTREIEKLKLK